MERYILYCTILLVVLALVFLYFDYTKITTALCILTIIIVAYRTSLKKE
jgi:hypothetical protein